MWSVRCDQMHTAFRFTIFAAGTRAFPLFFLLAVTAFAQTYTLSRKVSDSTGHVVPSASVSAKSVATGRSFSAETNSDGMYSIHDLAGGDYQVWAVAGELQAPPIKVTLAHAQTIDLVVSPAPKGGEARFLTLCIRSRASRFDAPTINTLK
jgi:Carboxypeptidase regulatory-like domain